jgi:ubiquinone/menaquinone biosynthesis C-methylase UbiE
MPAAHAPDIAAVVSVAAPRNGERWLDVGTGHGRLAIALAEAAQGAAIVGVDPFVDADPRAAASAAATAGVGDRVSFDRGELLALPFADHTFDGVVCHLLAGRVDPEDRTHLICEMHRVLAAGGRLVVSDADGTQEDAARTLADLGYADVVADGMILAARRPPG